VNAPFRSTALWWISATNCHFIADFQLGSHSETIAIPEISDGLSQWYLGTDGRA
jgi:hypothetical protein